MTYVVIAALGLIVKLMVVHHVLLRGSSLSHTLRPPIIVASVLFVTYSIPQILLLAPNEWGDALGLERFEVLRIYYYHGTLCLISSIYICLILLNFSFHRSIWMLFLIGCYAVIAAYFIIATDWLVVSSYQRMPFEIELSSMHVSPVVSLTRLAVVLILTGLLIGFLRAYRSASSNQAQIASFYALVAGLVFYANCVAGLFASHPLIFSIRGLFFFIAIMLVANDKRKFDARTLTPSTIENRVTRQLERVFRDFSNEKLGYRDAVKLLERELVNYKLNKVSGFKQDEGSSLPSVAENMQISLSSLYDLIKRMNLRRPDAP